MVLHAIALPSRDKYEPAARSEKEYLEKYGKYGIPALNGTRFAKSWRRYLKKRLMHIKAFKRSDLEEVWSIPEINKYIELPNRQGG